MATLADLEHPEASIPSRRDRSTRTVTWTLGTAALIAALISGYGTETANKAMVVLPLTAVVALVLAAVASTRFFWFVLWLLVVRSSVDALHLSAASHGTTAGNTATNRGVDPSSLLGLLFLTFALLWLAAVHFSRRQVAPSKITVWLTLFVAAGCLSITGSQHIQAGALQALRIMTAAIMFIVLEQLIVDGKTMRRVLVACYASMLIPIGYSLVGLASGNSASEVKSGLPRLIGTFSQSNDYARYLSFMIIFGIAVLHYVENRRMRIGLAILLTVGGVMLLLTLTLGAIGATVLGVIIVALFQRRKGLLVGLFVVCILSFVSIGGLGTRLATTDTPTQVGGGQTGNSVAWRFGYWAEVLPLANSNPLTGIGLSSTQYETSSEKQPHNDYLSAYVETGLVGLITYAGLLVAMATVTRRAIRRTVRGTFEHGVAVGAFACTVCFIVESAAANVISSVVNLWYLLAFIAAAAYVGRTGSTAAMRLRETDPTVDSYYQPVSSSRDDATESRLEPGASAAAQPDDPYLWAAPAQMVAAIAPAQITTWPEPAQPRFTGATEHIPEVTTATEPELSDADRSSSRDLSRMARGGGLNVLGSLVSQGSIFLIMTVLAHQLGRIDVGRYAECYALLTLLGLLSLAGFRAALTRFVAMYLADDDASRIRGTIRFGLMLTIVGSSAIALILVAASGQIAGALHDPTLRPAIILVALTLPASTFEDAALAATQGWRSQRSYTLIGLILDPGVRLVLTVVLLAAGAGFLGAMWALFAAAWLGALLSGLALHRRVHKVAPARPLVDMRRLFNFSIVSWGSTLATTGLVWADTLLLGYLSTQQSVGSYTVATRLVTLAIFVLTPINAAFVPHIAHLYHIGDRRGMARIYGGANRWIIRLSLPAFILLLVFPGDLLSFFGGSYRTAAAVTVILAIGQLINAAAGPCGSLLNMSGRVMLSLIDNSAVLVLNIVLNLILIPRYNIVGAAIAWSLSLTLANVAKIIQVRHYVHVRGEATGSAKTILAGVAAAAVALALTPILAGWLQALLVGGTVITVVFFGALALLGVADDDVAVIRGAVGRVVPRYRAVRAQ